MDPINSELARLIDLLQHESKEEAEKLAITITEKFPEHTFSWKVLGALFTEAGRLSEALDVKKKSVELDSQDADSHYNLGNAFNDMGRLEEAETSYKKSISLNPDFAASHNALGMILKLLNKLKESELCYRKAVLLDSDFAIAYYNMGITQSALLKSKEAEISYKKAITIKGDFFQAYNNLGNLLKGLNRMEEAEVSYKKAIAINSDFTEARINLGGLLKDIHRYQEALKHFDLVNNHYTKSQGLECLYKSESYIEFNERLNSIALEESINIRVAAVSAFASHQLKKDDPYPFCKNPLDFVVVENLSNYDLHTDSLIDGVLEEAENYKLTWESRTTKSGFQGQNNLFDNPSELVSRIELIIGNSIDRYFTRFNSESNTFINSWPKKSKLTGWYNKLLKNGYQTAHIHPGGWLSGVLYLKTAESLNSDEGAIELGLHGYELPIKDKNYPRKIYNPKKGDIVLFPSSLFHRTIPFTSDTKRCVIAFDLEPL